MFGSQESCEGLPQVGFKLLATVSGDCGGRAEASHPSADKRLSHCLHVLEATPPRAVPHSDASI